MSAASPGTIAQVMQNSYYPTQEAYLYALADAMRYEYQAIVAAGFLLQLDCPGRRPGERYRRHRLWLWHLRWSIECWAESRVGQAPVIDGGGQAGLTRTLVICLFVIPITDLK